MKTTHNKAQSTRILSYLKRGNSITPVSAMSRFKCMRLAARIADLRDRITSRIMQRNGKRFAAYSLA
jgi:hypothetical protein